MTAPTAWTPWPALGDIVDCRFPEVVGQPGPKERPALVLQVEENPDDPQGCVVVVAYATSQRTERVYAGEFVIGANGTTGLTKDTKFDLVNTHALPFDAAWFGAAPGTMPAHPKRGRLDLTDMEIKRKLQAAVMEAVQLQREQGSESREQQPLLPCSCDRVVQGLACLRPSSRPFTQPGATTSAPARVARSSAWSRRRAMRCKPQALIVAAYNPAHAAISRSRCLAHASDAATSGRLGSCPSALRRCHERECADG